MQRLLLQLLVIATLAAPSLAQTPGSQSVGDLPDRPIPVEELRGFDQYGAKLRHGRVSIASPQDWDLTRISRLYRFQADILKAQASGDASHAARLFDMALSELDAWTGHTDIMRDPRFRELYRSIVTEYDGYAGIRSAETIYKGVFAIRKDVYAYPHIFANNVFIVSKQQPVQQPASGEHPLAPVPSIQLRALEEPLLLQFSHLYHLQADILEARDKGDIRGAEWRLESAIKQMGRLAENGDVLAQPRYRELCRSLVAEYGFMGWLDTDSGPAYRIVSAIWPRVLESSQAPPAFAELVEPVATLAPVETSVPMTMNRNVRKVIDYFLKHRRKTLTIWLDRAHVYFPMIERILREEGVPDELKYLAVIESGLRPYVRSKVKATGMWQFMRATGRSYGLDVTNWIDERRDPEKATRAAAKHLKDLYYQYGKNWHVAMAGYNCSPRCIRRAISRTGGSIANPPSYWDMSRHLPSETRDYLPLYIAVAVILSNPAKYGLPTHSSNKGFAFDRVYVRGGLLLSDIAEMVQVDVETIKALNPELLRGMLPPGRTPYALRLPPDTRALFAEALEALPKEAKQPVTEYVVRRGDSLGKIGSRFGVSVHALMHTNNLSRTTIHPGQVLAVPGAGNWGHVAMADTPAETVQYGSLQFRPITTDLSPPRTSSSTTPVVLASTTEAVSGNTLITHRVQRGESLGLIAEKYGASVRSIMQLNNLRRTTIHPGQNLKIQAARQSSVVVHRVRRGENLGRIAEKYGTSVRSIMQLNNLRRTTIHPGQSLKIPARKSSVVVHRVQRGESLGRIANKYGTSVRSIMQLNNLRRTTIHPGQSLKIDE